MNNVGNFYQVLFLEKKYLGIKAHDEIVYSQIKELCAFVWNALLIENFFFTYFGGASIRVSTVNEGQGHYYGITKGHCPLWFLKNPRFINSGNK